MTIVAQTFSHPVHSRYLPTYLTLLKINVDLLIKFIPLGRSVVAIFETSYSLFQHVYSNGSRNLFSEKNTNKILKPHAVVLVR